MKKLPIGTKVFDARYGWGEVKDNYDYTLYSIEIIFKDKCARTYTSEGVHFEMELTPTLSLTKYDFVNGGFTPISEYKEDNKDLTKEFAEILGKLLDCEIIVKQKENL